MKYHCVDRLLDFEFHDSWWKLIRWNEDELVVGAEFLNVHRNALPEPTEKDMELEQAQIIIRGVTVRSFEPGQAWVTDGDGTMRTEDPQVTYTGGAAQALLMSELRSGITIHSLFASGAGISIEAGGMQPFFTACLTCGQTEIAWDGFRKPAWYEEKNRPF